MSGISLCSGLEFGTGDNLYHRTLSKEVKIRRLGHFIKDADYYKLDGEIVELVQFTHNFTYFANAADGYTPPAKQLPSSIMCLTEVAISFDKMDMAKQSFTWIEYYIKPDCGLVDQVWSAESITDCCIGTIGDIVSATLRKQMDYKIIIGPSGLDGIDDNSPATAIVYCIPTILKTQLQVTVDREPTGGIVVMPACGACSIPVPDGAKLIGRAENENYNTIKTWTLTYEKQESRPQ